MFKAVLQHPDCCKMILKCGTELKKKMKLMLRTYDSTLREWRSV